MMHQSTLVNLNSKKFLKSQLSLYQNVASTNEKDSVSVSSMFIIICSSVKDFRFECCFPDLKKSNSRTKKARFMTLVLRNDPNNEFPCMIHPWLIWIWINCQCLPTYRLWGSSVKLSVIAKVKQTLVISHLLWVKVDIDMSIESQIY